MLIDQYYEHHCNELILTTAIITSYTIYTIKQNILLYVPFRNKNIQN